jgi:transcriptional regulator with XRE-family HTH domain
VATRPSRGAPTAFELYRRGKRLTLTAIAAKTPCSLTHLSEIERGNRVPSEDLQIRLEAILGVPAEVLFPDV